MTVRLHPRTCERAREWASLRLDGELSEFEQVWLSTHLERCAGCAAYAASVTAATGALRSAEPLHLTQPVSLPARRRLLPVRALTIAGAAAAVAAAVGLGTLMGAVGNGPHALQPDVARASVGSQPTGE